MYVVPVVATSTRMLMGPDEAIVLAVLMIPLQSPKSVLVLAQENAETCEGIDGK